MSAFTTPANTTPAKSTWSIRTAWRKIKSFGKKDLPIRPLAVVEMACHLTNCTSSACSHVHPAYLALAPLYHDEADARENKTVSASDSTLTDTKSWEASSDDSREIKTVSASDMTFTDTMSFSSDSSGWSGYSHLPRYEYVSVRLPAGWPNNGRPYL